MVAYFVTTATDDQADVLGKWSIVDQMISYPYLTDKRMGFFPDYVIRGTGRYIDDENLKQRRN